MITDALPDWWPQLLLCLLVALFLIAYTGRPPRP